MIQFKISKETDKPVELVYKAFSDSGNMLKWTKNLEKVEIVRGKFGEKDALMLLHYNQKGRRYIMQDRLIEHEPFKMIRSEVSGGGLSAIVQTSFTVKNAGTLVEMSWQGRGKSFVMNWILKFMKKKIRLSAEAELGHFIRLVEEEGEKFH